MPIIKYIAIHGSPLSLFRYVTNEKKTEQALVSGINCSANAEQAYKEMEETFEQYSEERFWKKSLFMKKEITNGKEHIRLHHYIQSFKKDELTKEEAHRIGQEWVREVFGDKYQVLVSTHTDKGHYHNHFVVCPYDDNGKMWYANRESLNRCKNISDKIAKRHGLSVIEHPKKSYNHKYGNYLAQKRGASWKEKLKEELDEIVMRDDVRSVDDLVYLLQKKGYGINRGKYLAIKVKPDRKAIRTYRLGDGYFLEHLAYRIEHKNFEMPISEIAKYDGIQREYAICLRQIQIMLYRSPEAARPHYVSYKTVLKNAELLCYLHENKIRSADEFKSIVEKASNKYSDVDVAYKKLTDIISQEEKIVADYPLYKELVSKKQLTSSDRENMKKFSYLTNVGVFGDDDFNEHKKILTRLKCQAEKQSSEVSSAKAERDRLTDLYSTYTAQVQNDFNYLLEKAEQEKERVIEQEQPRVYRNYSRERKDGINI